MYVFTYMQFIYLRLKAIFLQFVVNLNFCVVRIGAFNTCKCIFKNATGIFISFNEGRVQFLTNDLMQFMPKISNFHLIVAL